MYIGFVVMVLSIVGYTMQKDVFLVSEDYYKQEIEYQKQIDKMENVANLSQRVTCKQDGDFIYLKFPEEFDGVKTVGRLQFFRPSDAKKDTQVDLDIEQLQQKVFVGNLDKGLWKLKISWKADDTDYFQEEKLKLL